MATTLNIEPMEFFRTVDGGPPFIMTFPEAASQTFKKGAPVKLVAGYVTALTSSETAGAQLLIGVADEPGHNDDTAGTHSVKVVIADNRTIFIASLDASQVAAYTDIGKSYGIATDPTTGHWTINKSAGPPATANRHAIIIALSPYPGDITDIQPRVLFRFHPVVLQLLATS